MATRKTAARKSPPRAASPKASKLAKPTKAVKRLKPAVAAKKRKPAAVAAARVRKSAAVPALVLAAVRPAKTPKRSNTTDPYAAFLASAAPIDVAKMQELDAAMSADGGDIRRAALAVLTRSGQELAQAVIAEEGAHTAAFLIACTERYRAPLGALLELLDTAAERVQLALSVRADHALMLAAARIEAGL
ncbi:MAG: hypothetical protein WCH32_14320 [Pseudomonadota bacterium]